MRPNLLIVDDEQNTRDGLELALEDEFEVFTASCVEEAVTVLNEEDFQVVLTDLRMPGESGMSVLDYINKLTRKPLCIMMTAYGEVDVAVEAMKRGAFDFLPKPVNLEQLEFLIKRGLKEQSQAEESIHVQKVGNKSKFDGILGKSASLESVMEKVRLVGPTKRLFFSQVKQALVRSFLLIQFIKIVSVRMLHLCLSIVLHCPQTFWKVNYLVTRKVPLPVQMRKE